MLASHATNIVLPRVATKRNGSKLFGYSEKASRANPDSNIRTKPNKGITFVVRMNPVARQKSDLHI